ncbi:phage integrase family protein [Pseudaquabacterium pictum]|nr:phage integrase family protein [Rubrivivax pictus]
MPADGLFPVVDRPAPLQPLGRPRGAQTRLLNSGAGPVGRHHFAFLRALLDGITLEQAWRTYLSFAGGPGDRRQALGQLRQLVQTLGRAGGHQGCAPAMAVALPALRALPDLARRRARHGAGNPGQSIAVAPIQAPPTLDDWRARQCGDAGIDEDFYTEAEWLALYADAFGTGAAQPAGAGIPGQLAAAPSPALAATADVRLAESVPAPGTNGLAPTRRRAVLDALATLELSLAREAHLGDATGLWLAGQLPRQLATAGVRTLGDLVSLINLQGFRWHRLVPGLGVVRAQRLLDWLLPVAEAGGQPVLETSRRPETDLVLARQRLRTPATASTRPAQATTSPATDAAVVSAWLDRHTGATRRAYARVTERFLRWASELRHQPLAGLTAADLQAYLDFVRAPPADWVQQRRVRRDSPAWRPFQGPLGPSSQRQELAVLASLLGDLHAAGQLPGHPAARILRRLDLPTPTVDVGRALSPAQWDFARQVLHEKPDTPARRRLQLLLALAGGAGLTLSELATTRLRALRRSSVDGEPAWLLELVGRAGRTRTVLVPNEVHALLGQHHRDMDAAGLGFDSAVARVQAPCPAPGSDAQGAAASTSPQDDPQAWRPLLGILRRPPPRRGLDALGLPVVDRAQPTQADRHGALERSAIDKLLRRFFHGVAREAAARAGAPAAEAFLAASSHWLRHSFAHRAAQQLSPPLLQQVLGHVSPRTAARYLATDTAAVVRGMRALQPPGTRPDSG